MEIIASNLIWVRHRSEPIRPGSGPTSSLESVSGPAAHLDHEPVAEVVMVTHQAQLELVAESIDALIDHTPGLRLIIVHNGNDPKPLEAWIHRRGAPARVIHTVNRGYAAAVNLAMTATTADKVMVLNDDVVVTPHWWPPLAGALDADPGLGAVQPLLLLPPGQAGPDHSGPDHAVPQIRINSAGVRLGSDAAGMDIGYGEFYDPTKLSPIEIGLFTGGAVMIRRSMWDALGGMDTSYFLYYEDVDLACRGAEAGWRYLITPTSQVVHAQGSTTSDSRHATKVKWLQERNRLWIAARFGEPSQIAGAVWLSTRRLRHQPRRLHLSALRAGLAAMPRLLLTRWRVRRSFAIRRDAASSAGSHHDSSC